MNNHPMNEEHLEAAQYDIDAHRSKVIENLPSKAADKMKKIIEINEQLRELDVPYYLFIPIPATDGVKSFKPFKYELTYFNNSAEFFFKKRETFRWFVSSLQKTFVWINTKNMDGGWRKSMDQILDKVEYELLEDGSAENELEEAYLEYRDKRNSEATTVLNKSFGLDL